MGNTVSNYTIIRVTPTLSTDAYAQGDVLFTATEIPNAVRGAGGCSLLMGAYVLDQADQNWDAYYVFSEGNTALGTINATADINNANMEALGLCGVTITDVTQASTIAAIDTNRISQMISLGGTGEGFQPLTMLQAAAGSTSVYVQAVIREETPTFAAVDDIDLILHIQYR